MEGITTCNPSREEGLSQVVTPGEKKALQLVIPAEKRGYHKL
jgi:hypothetical protein